MKYTKPLRAFLKKPRTWDELLANMKTRERSYPDEFLRNSLAYMQMKNLTRYDAETETWFLFVEKKLGKLRAGVVAAKEQSVETLPP